MKIISWNVNGIRAAVKKGFLEWFQKTKADIVCLQEVRAEPEQIPANLVKPHGYYVYFNTARKKGYSGVAVYTKEKPLKVEHKLGMKRFDQEGRILNLEYQNFTLINIYLPNGGRQKENLGYKLKVYQYLLNYLKENKNKCIVLTGDFNVAHQEIDLARPKQNYHNTMFTVEERKQIDKIISINLVDTFRVFNKKGKNYTWWTNFANARHRNLGWRIDYVFVSQKLIPNLKKAFILPEVKGSDHCPVGIEIKIEKYWSDKVTRESNALDLEQGVFKLKDPRRIASSLKYSAEASVRRKGTPFQSAMSMLNFYINRAGNNLSVKQKEILEQTKQELRIIFGRKH